MTGMNCCKDGQSYNFVDKNIDLYVAVYNVFSYNIIKKFRDTINVREGEIKLWRRKLYR